jgi:hypothetical protein
MNNKQEVTTMCSEKKKGQPDTREDEKASPAAPPEGATQTVSYHEEIDSATRQKFNELLARGPIDTYHIPLVSDLCGIHGFAIPRPGRQPFLVLNSAESEQQQKSAAFRLLRSFVKADGTKGILSYDKSEIVMTVEETTVIGDVIDKEKKAA